jgi:putative heme-binding domain-containing protein
MMRDKLPLFLIITAVLLSAVGPAFAQDKKEVIPHGQSQPPGPPLSPQDALKKMRVPDGFRVELVAAEPDIVNPVAMTFDERGRIWITESLEYPRREPGKGRDRIKVLESTKGDGKYDKITVFAEGLNIPSGIAVGHGGVWLANSPDILFYKEGPDGKALGEPEVVVTGFGRADTHELPNSLTWGPDGWLYGLNGVFNPSVVKHKGKEYRFTCALFRIHPKTRDFELFCEGTSNPWGIGIDTEGSFFVSACVIDHLWHLTETGYYLRQGGPYPPFTWILGSIVKHKHQKAAYCGLHFFDSDAYPEPYREKLYMGNIHGNCVNSDELTREGSTYFAKPRDDFLTANDAWFMPVSQKTGPDGCLYILDWYDRYHCYQDANRDPAGIDRLKGRLYRVRYKDSPPAGLFDLKKESDDELIQRLHSPNVYFRDIAQRLLTERSSPQLRDKLMALVENTDAPRKARLHALWALVGGGSLEVKFHRRLLRDKDPTFRAWAVRAAGNMHELNELLRDQVALMVEDPSPDVLLQVAIAAAKIEGLDPLPVLVRVLAQCGDDRLIPGIVWQNLQPLLEARGGSLVEFLKKAELKASPGLTAVLPRAVERLLASKAEPGIVTDLVSLTLDSRRPFHTAAGPCLAMVAAKVQNGELAGERLAAVGTGLKPGLARLMADAGDSPVKREAVFLAATLKDPAATAAMAELFRSTSQDEATRLKALNALVAGGHASVLDGVALVLADPQKHSIAFRGQVLAALGKMDHPRIAELVLDHYPRLEPELQPRAIELLTQRVHWSKKLLAHIAEKKVPASALNVNHVRKLTATKDPELIKTVTAVWGIVRDDRNPEREKVVAQMREHLKKTPGDPMKGVVVFRNLCGQCHKLHGEGQDVGPDITANGRSDFEQLLSNVFDPSLVIGSAYQATTVITTKGQTLTGLLVEDSPQRVVLKVQGGKLETIPRDQVDEVAVSKVSLMPEGVEKQLKPEEIADLFAYLCLDKPPTDPTAKRIPGTPNPGQ